MSEAQNASRTVRQGQDCPMSLIRLSLLAQSFPDAILSTAVWEHAVELDQAAQWRLTLKNDRTKKEAVNG